MARAIAAFVAAAASTLAWFMAGAAPTSAADPCAGAVLNAGNGHTYLAIAVANGVNWYDAHSASQTLVCGGFTGHLATITSVDEQTFIETTFPAAARPASDHGYWIGGRRVGSAFTWVTGEAFTYTNWNSGEPSGDADGAIHFFGFGTARWNDATASLYLFPGYVVEFDGNATSQPANFSLALAPATAENPVGSSHAVEAVLTNNGQPVGAASILFAVTGANTTNASSLTNTLGKASFAYTGTNVGADTITACHDADADATCDVGEAKATAQKLWLQVVQLTAACSPTTNPSGRNTPKAGASSGKSGQNPDGFYVLAASDPAAQLWLADSGSSFVSGPYASGTRVKVTQAPGATPSAKPMAGAVAAHVKLRGDALVSATSGSSTSAPASCTVAPPPK